MPKIRESKVTIFLSRGEELENNLLTWIKFKKGAGKFFVDPSMQKLIIDVIFLKVHLVRCLYGFW